MRATQTNPPNHNFACSCLASSAPEHVVYMSIVRTAKRPYMALVTSVEPQWLADCGSSLCTGVCVWGGGLSVCMEGVSY